MASFYWFNNPMKDLVLINCWSMSAHESYALWRIYLGGEQDGIAIKTTVSRLCRSVEYGGDEHPEEFFIGKVSYKTHINPDDLSRFSVITTKKPFYDFEKEVRMFVLNYPLSEGGHIPPYDMSLGRKVRVDLNELVHEVYISPFSSKGYKEKVRSLIMQSNLKDILIKESEIRDQ